jgi:phosphoribosylformylglycinamidine cyclo-ligase
VEPGDVLLGLPSAGLHTNGYSLARKLFFEVAGYDVDTRLEALGETVGEALLRPHLSYLRPLEALLDTGAVKALAHITGGGLLENIPRVLPEGTAVEIEKGSWDVPALFRVMQGLGNVAEAEMYRTFNMGVGMVVVCTPADALTVKTHLDNLGETCYTIGRVTEGAREVILA